MMPATAVMAVLACTSSACWNLHVQILSQATIISQVIIILEHFIGSNDT